MTDHMLMAPYFREQLALPCTTLVCDLPAGTRMVQALHGKFVAAHPEHVPLLIHPWGPQPLRPGQIVEVERAP